ncbi:hypothetical protein C6496_07670 [Candidatus Poribacteria bacterium]|nr:MAG: hypothetical protein C6496_07670 [Candidatus Poribacteria bacterium]
MRFTGIVVLLFLLPFSAAAGTFIETFDGKDMEEWRELVQVNNPPGLWETVKGELEVVNRDPSLYFFITGDETWEDYTVKFDVKPLKKHGIGGIAIAARVKESWLVYCAIRDIVIAIDDKAPVHEIGSYCLAGDLHDTVFIRIAAAPHPLLKLDKWSHLKLDVSEGMLTFWVNEEQVMGPTEFQLPGIVQDELGFPGFLTGGAGFGLANYTARFDNIIVTGDSIPNKGRLSVTSKGKLATTWGDLKRF